MTRLIIPKKIRRTGLYVYCNKCKQYSNIKDGYLRNSIKCNHPFEKQVYKIRVHIPASVKKCRTISLETRDINLVLKEYDLYKEQLQITNYIKCPDLKEEENEVDSYLLLYQMKKYLDYLNNVDVPAHMQKTLSQSTINDYRRNFKYFIECLESDDINVTILRIDQITNWHVELFHKYLVGQGKANKSYNNIMSSLKVFYGHLTKIVGSNLNDPFKLVRNKKVVRDTQTFSFSELASILKAISPETGADNQSKNNRNRYKSWLAGAIKLAAFCCLRLEELVNLKYKDIKESPTNDYKYIQAENIKVNKKQGNNEESNKQIKHIPLIAELLQVLQDDFALADNVGKDKYIIAPLLSRQTVYNDITKGFTHYKRVAGIVENNLHHKFTAYV